MNVCKVASRIRLPIRIYWLQITPHLQPYLQPYNALSINILYGYSAQGCRWQIKMKTKIIQV